MNLNPLRLGQVKPHGWTLALMRRDFESGFVGHLDQENASPHPWWNSETQGNWRDGWLRHALLVGEGKGRLLARAWVNRILATQDSDGDFWAQATLYRALLGYYEATGESRVLEAVVRAVQRAMDAGPLPPYVLDELTRLTGDHRYRTFAGLDRESEAQKLTVPSGAPLGDEESDGDFCSIVGLFDSYAALLRQTGDRLWADKMEHLLFNAALGAQNQFRSSPVQPSAVCCVSNAGRILPSFVRHQVLADPQGLRIALYGPALVKTEVAGQPVALEMETDYPDALTVELRLYPEVPVEFSLFLRIPEWAEGTLVTGDGASGGEMTDRDGWLELRRIWNRGDSLNLTFEAKIEGHQDHRGQTWFTRGPLVWALPLADRTGSSDWSLAPGGAEQARWSDGAVEVPLVGPEGTPVVHRLLPLKQTLLRQVTFPEAAP